MNIENFKVCVRCMTYNHAHYIVDALNGFCMQKTDFPYVCTIIDDNSRDGESEVIKQYLQEHFNMQDKSLVRNEETDDYVLTFARHSNNLNCFFAVLFLKYNHFSISKSKEDYIKEWNDYSTYIAICEGDDYWIDPMKLQRQVSYMESNKECVMTCNRSKLLSVSQKKYVGEQYCRKSDGVLNPVDVINRTGLYISTCSVLYRPFVKINYPAYCAKCRTSDYALQIMCAMKGNIYYFDKVMSVYRVDNPKSWMGKEKRTIDYVSWLHRRFCTLDEQVAMFDGFANSYPAYRKVFKEKIADQINRGVPGMSIPRKIRKEYLSHFSDVISSYSFKWKIDLMIRTARIPKLRGLYTRVFQHRYSKLVFKY